MSIHDFTPEQRRNLIWVDGFAFADATEAMVFFSNVHGQLATCATHTMADADRYLADKVSKIRAADRARCAA